MFFLPIRFDSVAVRVLLFLNHARRECGSACIVYIKIGEITNYLLINYGSAGRPSCFSKFQVEDDRVCFQPLYSVAEMFTFVQPLEISFAVIIVVP